MRSIARLALAGATLAGALGLAAPVAHAQIDTTLITLVGVNCVPNKVAVRGNAGSAFTVRSDGTCVGSVVNAGNRAPVTPAGTIITAGGSATFTLASSGSGSLTVVPDRPGTGNYSIAVAVTSDYIPPPLRHDYIQQVGVPASGTCADVDPSAGHYPGFPFGGWSRSWAQWINEGRGGLVCHRELLDVGGEVRLIG